MICGDSASLVNSQRLKGIHLAIKSGMLAAETAFEALLSQKFDADQLGLYPERVENSWIKEELWPVRNFHQGFEDGFYTGMLNMALQQVTGGAGLIDPLHCEAGYERMQKLVSLSPTGDDRAHMLGAAKGDGKLTFDKLTDVYHSGTKHEEDQPSHLVVADLNICATTCRVEYGNPCERFCPASVYEMVEDPAIPGAKQLHINASNCVHCKTCDIADPYQIINWVPPEGGGGPNYDGM